MHELSVTSSILSIALQHAAAANATKIVSIHLQIGEIRDIVDEWMQRYFDYVSKDTIAQGATLKIIRTPVSVQCEECQKVTKIKLEQIDGYVCPHCASEKIALVGGQVLFIESVEVI